MLSKAPYTKLPIIFEAKSCLRFIIMEIKAYVFNVFIRAKRDRFYICKAL